MECLLCCDDFCDLTVAFGILGFFFCLPFFLLQPGCKIYINVFFNSAIFCLKRQHLMSGSQL